MVQVELLGSFVGLILRGMGLGLEGCLFSRMGVGILGGVCMHQGRNLGLGIGSGDRYGCAQSGCTLLV